MLDARLGLADVVDDASTEMVAQDDEASCLELEREMVAVARSLHSARVRFACPVCDDPMDLHDVVALQEFGALDIKLHQLECGTCGMIASRVYHPSVGYHSHKSR